MSKEEQYFIAMIVLAGVCGALLIGVIIVICCCMKYQRRLYGTGTRVTKHYSSYEQTQWPVVSPYEACGEACGASSVLEGDQSHVYPHSGVHHERQGYVSPYSCALPASTYQTTGVFMTPGVTKTNPCPVASGPQCKTGNEYKKVLLNPPNAVCSKPPMPSTQLNGKCGTGGGCDGNFYSMSTGQPVTYTGGSQFVLESGGSKQY